jgi:hypothetical protein
VVSEVIPDKAATFICLRPLSPRYLGFSPFFNASSEPVAQMAFLSNFERKERLYCFFSRKFGFVQQALQRGKSQGDRSRRSGIFHRHAQGLEAAPGAPFSPFPNRKNSRCAQPAGAHAEEASHPERKSIVQKTGANRRTDLRADQNGPGHRGIHAPGV